MEGLLFLMVRGTCIVLRTRARFSRIVSPMFLLLMTAFMAMAVMGMVMRSVPPTFFGFSLPVLLLLLTVLLYLFPP